MKLTKHQKNKLLGLDISGKGGKDAEIAAALGFSRKSSKFYDAVDDVGRKWEFKKQQHCQFLDPYKFAQMTKEERGIQILFFMHKKGKIVEIYKTTYNKLIKTMGYSAWDLKAIKRLYERKCFINRSNTQIKAELKPSEIRKFKLVWKKKEEK